MVLVGIDWSERWHDVCLMDEDRRVLGRRRVDDSAAGLTQLQSLIADAGTPLIAGISLWVLLRVKVIGTDAFCS